MGVVAAAVTGIYLCLNHGVDAISGSDYTRPAHILRAIAATGLTVPLIVVARRKLDREAWSGLRLTSLARGWRPFFFGVACWAVPAAAAAFVVLALDHAQVEFTVSGSEVATSVCGLVVLVFLYEALPEELIFRGYFFANLDAAYSQRLAIVGQALLFTLWGVAIGAATSIDRIVLFLVFAYVLGRLRATTDNLWSTIGFHLAFQTTAQFLLGSAWPQAHTDDPNFWLAGAVVVAPFTCTLLLCWVLRRVRSYTNEVPTHSNLGGVPPI